MKVKNKCYVKYVVVHVKLKQIPRKIKIVCFLQEQVFEKKKIVKCKCMKWDGLNYSIVKK